MKNSFHFAVHISTDKATGRLLAVYFQIRKGLAAKVREFANGNAFANYKADGKLLGVEVIGPCNIKVVDMIAPKEPAVREFIKTHVPAALTLRDEKTTPFPPPVAASEISMRRPRSRKSPV